MAASNVIEMIHADTAASNNLRARQSFTSESQYKSSVLHEDPICGDIALGPLGKLDGGQLTMKLLFANIRTPTVPPKQTVSPDQILRNLDYLDEHATEKSSMSIKAVVQYAQLSDAAVYFIESEPNLKLQFQMRDAVKRTIEEAITKQEPSNEVFLSEEHSNARAQFLDYNMSTRIPALESSSYLSQFAHHLKSLHFFEPQVLRVWHDIIPTVSRSPLSYDHENVNSAQSFLNYEMHHIFESGEDENVITTAPFFSGDNFPIFVIRIMQITAAGDKTLGISSFDTTGLLDFKKPMNIVCRNTQPNLEYVLTSQGESVTENNFSDLWRMTQFLKNSKPSIEEGAIISAAQASAINNGLSKHISTHFSISAKRALNCYIGEVGLLLYFVPRVENQKWLFCKSTSLKEARQSYKVLLDKNRDVFGAPIIRIPYDHNLPLCHRFLRRKGAKDFHQIDQENIIYNEMLADVQHQHALQRWKHCLWSYQKDESQHNWWKVISHMYSTQTTWASDLESYDADGSLSNYGLLPSYVIEVWSNGEFCGELPISLPLSGSLSSQSVHKLQPWNENNPNSSRNVKTKAQNPNAITGWIYIQLRWRFVSATSGRLNIRLRELRNISAKSTELNKAQPGTPQVIVFEKLHMQKEWKEIQKFSMMEKGTYFLQPSHVRKLMASKWDFWDKSLIGAAEPVWENCFSYDESGSDFNFEEREIPVELFPTHDSFHQLPSIFEILTTEDEAQEFSSHANSCLSLQAEADIWQLCKCGIPALMRMWIWPEISGARAVKESIERRLATTYGFKKSQNNSSFAYVLQPLQKKMLESLHGKKPVVFNQLEQDLRELQCTYGISDSTLLNDIENILKCLIILTSKQQLVCIDARSDYSEEETDNHRVAYSKSLTTITYFMLLDQGGGYRMTQEDALYLLYALIDKNVISRAPYAAYFSYSHCFDQNTELIPAPLRDALLVKSAIELLHPKKYLIMKSAGFHLEVFLFSAFMNLFAGYLPTESLFRMWDILFCTLACPKSLTNIDITYGELQRAAENSVHVAESGKKKSLFFLCCDQPRALDEELAKGDRNLTLGELFDHSTGRRAMIAFAFSLITDVLEDLRLLSSPQEIQSTIECHLSSIRNPSRVIQMIEKGDFYIFSSNVNLKFISILWRTYVNEKFNQLLLHSKQNQLLQRIFFKQTKLKNIAPSQIAVSFNESCKIRNSNDFLPTMIVNSPLSLKDLTSKIYPMLKYQALYASLELRSFPSGIMGYFLLKFDSIEFENSSSQRTISTIDIYFGSEHRIIQARTNESSSLMQKVVHFNISGPPPYTFDISFSDESGKKIGKLKDGLRIKKLISTGETYREFCSKLNEIESDFDLKVTLSWYTFTHTNEMFMPTLGGRDVLINKRFQFGCRIWGDLTGFHQMNVEIITEVLIKQLKAAIDPAIRSSVFLRDHLPLEKSFIKPRPTSMHGLTKTMLDELFFFSLPSLLPFTEDLIVNFGSVREKDNFQIVNNTEVALREIIAAIILISHGTVVEKANLLFDLFGHYDPACPQTAQFQTYYNMNPYKIGPDVADIGNSLDQFWPEEISNSYKLNPSPNSISLAECTAVLQTVLLRNLIHIDNIQAFHMAGLIFGPGGNVPRVLKATIKGDFPMVYDVLGPILRFIARECGRTGIYGLNFTCGKNLEDLKIKNYESGKSKILEIIVSKDGSFENVEIITLKTDGEGKFLSGHGGNINDVIIDEIKLPQHLQKLGPYSKLQSDINKEHVAANGCYVFDYHETIIDKFSFISKFATCDILSEPIRQAAVSMVKPLVQYSNNKVKVDVKVELPIDSNTLQAIAPFQLSNKKMIEGKKSDTNEFRSTAKFSATGVHNAYMHDNDSIEKKNEEVVQNASIHSSDKSPDYSEKLNLFFFRLKIINLTGVKQNIKERQFSLQLQLASQNAFTEYKNQKEETICWDQEFQLSFTKSNPSIDFIIVDEKKNNIAKGRLHLPHLFDKMNNSKLSSVMMTNLNEENFGALNVETELFVPPRNCIFNAIRVTIHEVSGISATLQNPYINLILDNKIKSTKKTISNGTLASWEEFIYFDYQLEQNLCFEVVSEEKSLCGVGLSLWTFLHKKNKRIAGTIPLSTSQGTRNGQIQFTLEFTNTPNLPFPQHLQVSIISAELKGANKAHFSVSCGTNKQKSHSVLSHETGSIIALADSKFIFPYAGESRVEIEFIDETSTKGMTVKAREFLDVWNILRSATRERSQTLTLKMNDSVSALLTCHVSFFDPPKCSQFPDYCRIIIDRAESIKVQTRLPHVKIVLDRYEMNTQSLEIKAGSDLIWNWCLLLPYSGQRNASIKLIDGNTVLGTGSLNFWKMMQTQQSKPRTTSVQIFRGNEPAGFVTLRLEFITRPAIPNPDGLRIILKHLTSLMRTEKPMMIKLHILAEGVLIMSESLSCNDVKLDKQDLYIPLNGQQELTFEMWDHADETPMLIGKASHLIWDFFQNANDTFNGEIKFLCNGNKLVGHLSLMMRLVFKQIMCIGFGTNTPGFEQLNDISIFEDDTVLDFKNKIINACKKISDQPTSSVDQIKIFKIIQSNFNEYKVVIPREENTPVELNDRRTFSDYKELWQKNKISLRFILNKSKNDSVLPLPNLTLKNFPQYYNRMRNFNSMKEEESNLFEWIEVSLNNHIERPYIYHIANIEEDELQPIDYRKIRRHDLSDPINELAQL